MKHSNTRFLCLLILLLIVNKLHSIFEYSDYYRSLTIPDKRGLTGFYFDKSNDFSDLKFIHIDRMILFPGIGYFHGLGDLFGVIWVGLLYAPESGRYTIGTISNDSSWVFINGKKVIENGDGLPHDALSKSTIVRLSKGSHPIIVKYNQHYNTAKMRLFWRLRKSGEIKRTVPCDVLTPVRKTFWGDINFIGNVFIMKNLFVGMIIILACYYKFQLAFNRHFF